MNRLICNSVDYVFLSEIKFFENGVPVLKHDAKWKNIKVTDRPLYTSDIKQSDAGATNQETLSARSRYDEDELLLSLSHLYTILRLKTDNDTFFMGSSEYPVITELNHNKVYTNYSFIRNSEA
ncbi:hypothetical protein D0T49_01970 [Paludibacter sp. 221]|uniref:hypothetical protein n=1 Tax=Paludibacter sp. 221 TaxID=2302939 RepID=UPI0013D33477|nr:hypothetical protein [Paludibacter sp. 221]NDV45817.1 hypothetical protein [Paludibacter sp. 221]